MSLCLYPWRTVGAKLMRKEVVVVSRDLPPSKASPPKRFGLDIACRLNPCDHDPVYGQDGVDLSFPRALPASIWGNCSQVLVFTSIWGTQKRVWQRHFRAVFPSIWVSWDPQTPQNKGKRKMTNRPCFTPPPMPWPSKLTTLPPPPPRVGRYFWGSDVYFWWMARFTLNKWN